MRMYGTKLRLLRKAAGLTQAQVGEKLGITGVMVSKLEKDQLDPSVERLQQFAELFGVSLSEFDQARAPECLKIEGDHGLVEKAIQLLQAAGLEIIHNSKTEKRYIWMVQIDQ